MLIDGCLAQPLSEKLSSTDGNKYKTYSQTICRNWENHETLSLNQDVSIKTPSPRPGEPQGRGGRKSVLKPEEMVAIKTTRPSKSTWSSSHELTQTQAACPDCTALCVCTTWGFHAGVLWIPECKWVGLGFLCLLLGFAFCLSFPTLMTVIVFSFNVFFC